MAGARQQLVRRDALWGSRTSGRTRAGFSRAQILNYALLGCQGARVRSPSCLYLDDANTVADLPTYAELVGYKNEGVQIVAPPIFALLADDGSGHIVPSTYARNAKAAGLDIITWTLERSGILADGGNGFYYQSFDTAIKREGDMMQVLDVLAREIGILGIFSDWPATTTFYANGAGLR